MRCAALGVPRPVTGSQPTVAGYPRTEGFAWLLPLVTSKKSFAYCAGLAAIAYSAGLMRPRPPPLIWFASATRPAHCGQLSEVPPTPVTSGSLAGHSTVGNGKGVGFLTGVFLTFALPPSPDEPSTVTPLAAAEM